MATMSNEPKTVPAFVIVADGRDGAIDEIALFYRAIDADAFVVNLPATRKARIEARQVPVSEVHPAHHDLFPKHFPKPAR